jgi:hypothetical protein
MGWNSHPLSNVHTRTDVSTRAYGAHRQNHYNRYLPYLLNNRYNPTLTGFSTFSGLKTRTTRRNPYNPALKPGYSDDVKTQHDHTNRKKPTKPPKKDDYAG